MEREFTSKLEELIKAKELIFPATPAFGDYKHLFPEEARSHPAKMNTKLLEWLILTFTEEGDVILDPMAGTGSTGVLAALHGRNAIQVELEPKFYQWMEKAREKVEKHPSLTSKGWIRNICGDARRLSDLLNQADVAITSPPYAETQAFQDIEFMKRTSKEQSEKVRGGEIKRHYMTEEARITVFERIEKGKIENPENIGLLPFGSISTIITSPPYLDVDNVKLNSEEFWQKAKESGKRWGSKPPAGTDQKQMSSPENIGNLPLGDVDAIITSPPFGDSYLGGRDPEKRRERLIKAGYNPKDFLGGKARNAVLKHYDEVSENPENVGNFKRETYLEAMLKVYGEMYKVLKPNGRAIIVVKPFIRNKEVVDLPWYTWLLLQKVGFKLREVYKFRLPSKSFWRILYEKHFPEVPRIMHEYIIIVEKPTT